MDPGSTPLAQQLLQSHRALARSLEGIVEQALTYRLDQDEAAKRCYALLKPPLGPAAHDGSELGLLAEALQACRSACYRWRARRLNGYLAINEIARALQTLHARRGESVPQ
jgi:hypothetical protein